MFMLSLIMNPEIYFLIGALLAAGIILAVVFGMRYKRALNGEFPDNVTLARGIGQNAEAFEGLYEPVYQISLGETENREETFAAWNERVAASEMSDDCKRIFAEQFGDYADWGRRGKKIRKRKSKKIYTKKAEKLVKLFDKANVVRSADIFEKSGETTAERYALASGEAILLDTRYFVASPCWTCGDAVVNKGVIE